MRPDQVAESLARLEPESRALLELSVVRGLSDEDIAGVLGVQPGRIALRRTAVLQRLMDDLDARSPEDRVAIERALRGEPAAPSADEPPAAPEPQPEEAPVRRLSPALAAALLGGLGIAVVVALALARTDSKPKSPAASPSRAGATAGDSKPTASRAPVALRPIVGGPATGSAQVVRSGGGMALRVRVRGLPSPRRGGYVVWLYNSVADAQELTGSRRGDFSSAVPLPPKAGRYRFLDVSREPPDGNRNHSGASVLRVGLEELRQ
jgi:Anti-sigma-K factor rskA